MGVATGALLMRCEPPATLPTLTRTEMQVLHLRLEGMGTSEIAATLGRNPAAIRWHLDNIRSKCGGDGKGPQWWTWLGRQIGRMEGRKGT